MNTLKKNIFFSLTSQAVILFSNMLTVIFLPKVLNVNEFGYWQLYLLYSSYIGFMHFGFIDGIFLSEGGKKINELKNVKVNAIKIAFFQVLVSVLLFCIILNLDMPYDKYFVLSYTIFSIVFVNLTSYFNFLLIGTNEFNKYFIAITISKSLLIFSVITFYWFNINRYEYYIYIDLAIKIINLTIVCFMFSSHLKIKGNFNNIFRLNNKDIILLKNGFHLMFANIVGLLLIGIIRFMIEKKFSIKDFGEISLLMSTTSLILVFLSGIGNVLFPTLRRIENDSLKESYFLIRKKINMFLYASLILYFPLKIIIEFWLPNYNSALIFLPYIFPIIIFEGKITLLINTYYKVLNIPKKLMQINSIVLFVNLIILLIFSINSIDIYYYVILIPLILCLRYILVEYYLSFILKADLKRFILFDCTIVVLFILLSKQF